MAYNLEVHSKNLPINAAIFLKAMQNQVDRPEPNPIYWLEMRLACRSCLPYVFGFFGCVMGIYLIVFALLGSNIDHSVTSFLFAIPMAFWAIGPLAVPFLLLRNFSDQLKDSDDLMLRTAMTGREILWGKLRLAVVLLLYLYLPTLPGNLLCLCMAKQFMPLSCAAGFIGSLCLCGIGLGFLSGGKTTARQQILMFLSFIFIFFTLVLSYAIMEPVHALFYHEGIIRCDYWTAMILTISTIFMFWMFSAGFVYGMGVMILSRSRRLSDVLKIVFLLFALILSVQASFLDTVVNPLEQVVPYMIMWTFYAGPPIVALAMAVF